jgi:hypothetical protein
VTRERPTLRARPAGQIDPWVPAFVLALAVFIDSNAYGLSVIERFLAITLTGCDEFTFELVPRTSDYHLLVPGPPLNGPTMSSVIQPP